MHGRTVFQPDRYNEDLIDCAQINQRDLQLLCFSLEVGQKVKLVTIRAYVFPIKNVMQFLVRFLKAFMRELFIILHHPK